MRRGTLDVLYGSVLLLVGGFLLRETFQPQYADTMGLGAASDPGFYPRILLSLWLALAAIIVIRGLFTRGSPVEALSWPRIAGAVALLGLGAWLITAIGFLPAAALTCLALMLLMGYRRPAVLALVGIAFPIVTWYVFEFVLNLPLPTSPWFGPL